MRESTETINPMQSSDATRSSMQ